MNNLIRILLLIVNVVLALLLVASTLAGVIPPSKCILFSFLSYGYFYFLLANIIFVLIWLFFARKECIVSILTIAIRYTFLPLFFQFGGNTVAEVPTDSIPQLKVMTWNVHQFYGTDNDRSVIDSNAKVFLKLLHEKQPDVMSLQEFYVPPKAHLNDSLKALGYKYSYGINKSSKDVPYGVALFSKYPISYASDLDRSQKFFADINWNDQIVRIVCVHLAPYRLDSIDQRGFTQVVHGTVDSTTHRTYRKFRETIRAHETEWHNELLPIISETSYPLILAGDFNDTPASYLYQQAKDYLHDSYVEQGKGFCTTYHGKFPNFRIDYIMHSSHLEALSYERIKSTMSDHYPIIVTFQL